MHDTDLYAQILGVRSPWAVRGVEVSRERKEVHVRIELDAGAQLCCPECGRTAASYDRRMRSWRHLDTCQFQTYLHCEVPRVQCAEHQVRQVRVPWAEPGSRFTALFEAVVIDWLLEASILAVARLMDLTWDEAAGIQERAVRRGLERRKIESLGELGIDETSFQKRHEYVTVVIDQVGDRVVYVGDDRKQATLDAFYRSLSPQQLGSIDVVAMDMWEPYIRSTREFVPGAEEKTAFDRFHVAQHLSRAVDKVRRQEHRELLQRDDTTLKGTRYLWLQNPENLDEARLRDFAGLKNRQLKVARAWAIKEAARDLWSYRTRGWAARAWKRWIGWALRSRLEPIRAAARTVKNHLQGILTAIVLGVTNARSEAINANIQWIKRLGRGYRNRERFRQAIYFRLGGLDLYPQSLEP